MFLQNRYYEAKVLGFPIINQIRCLQHSRNRSETLDKIWLIIQTLLDLAARY